MRGLFVSGTDTGCGKTVFTAALCRLWRRQNRPFRVCKPVATGSREDADRRPRPAGEDGAAIPPWLLPEPAAPPVSARLAGVRLGLAEIRDAVRGRCPPGGAVLVEGVGGLLCPLTETALVADLVAALGIPLV